MKLNPNRMTLLKLRRRLKFAIRGHKLLKDKQEQLTKEFNTLILKLIDLRKEIEDQLNEVYSYLKILHTYMSKETLNFICEEFSKRIDYKLEEKISRKYNLKYTEYVLKNINKDLEIFTTDPFLNIILLKMQKLYPLILKLSNFETLCELLSKELETTRRRVNALEYILIPQIQQGIKFIIDKLNEFERNNISQLMRIKALME